MPVYTTPVSNDAYWEENSEAVRAFLVEPRSWKELTAWARENRVSGTLLRHALAWCEHAGRAVSYETPDGWFWAVPAAQKAVGA